VLLHRAHATSPHLVISCSYSSACRAPASRALTRACCARAVSPAPARALSAPVSSTCLRSLLGPPPRAARTPGRCRSGPCAYRGPCYARASRASAPPRTEPSRRRIAGAQRRYGSRACPASAASCPHGATCRGLPRHQFACAPGPPSAAPQLALVLPPDLVPCGEEKKRQGKGALPGGERRKETPGNR
jgi:hypothetical protein